MKEWYTQQDRSLPTGDGMRVKTNFGILSSRWVYLNEVTRVRGDVAWPSHVRGTAPTVKFNREYLLNGLLHKPRTFTIRFSASNSIYKPYSFVKIVNFSFNHDINQAQIWGYCKLVQGFKFSRL